MNVESVSTDTLVAITSAALTGMSLIVAAVALIFTHRQNVGWKPIILTNGQSMQNCSDDFWTFDLSTGLEFWNRRRYPVSIRFVSVEVSGVEVRQVETKTHDDWHWQNSTGFKTEAVVVEPHQRCLIPVNIPLAAQSTDAMKPLLKLAVTFFDPYLKRHHCQETELKFFYPEFGWKLSDEERSRRKAAWQVSRKQNHG